MRDAEIGLPPGDRAAAAPPPPASAGIAETRIFSILSQYAAMQVVLAATGVVRNKVVAFRLGPTGFGEISQIAAIVSVAVTLVCFGMGVSLSRNAAACRTLEGRQEHLENANGIVGTLALVVTIAMIALLASGHLLGMAALTPTPATITAALIFVATIPLAGLQGNYLALLQGILDVRGLAFERSVAVLLATVVSIPVVWLFGLVGAAVQYLLLTAFVTVLLARRCRTLGYAPLRVRVTLRGAGYLASFAVVSMVSGFAQGFSDAAVRTSLIATAGAAANGLLQAPYAIAMMVKGVVLASVGSVSLATIASKDDPAEVSAAIARLLNVVVPVGAAALSLLGLFGAPAMALLYSRAFASGASLFPYVLSADLLLVFVWVVGAPLLARSDRVLWLALELIHAGARWALAVVLMRYWGGLAVVVALLVAVALHLALNVAVLKFRYRLHLSARHARRLLVGLVLVVSLSIVGGGSGSPAFIGAGLVVWAAYTVHHARSLGLVASLRRRL